MNLSTEVLDVLKCGVCGVQLSRGPVYLQHDGAALCGSCYTPETKATRNVHYEALAQHAVFPCKYKDLGCEDTVPFVQGSQVIPHEEVCEHRQWLCPVLGAARCDWLGPKTQFLQHCEDQHSDLVLQSPCSLQHDFVSSNDKTYLLCALQVLFLLHVKVSVAMGKLYYMVHYLGCTEEAKDFLFKLHVKRNDESISKKREVAPQGCLEDTSLTLDIHSLLSVLGGFDGAMFTVEVTKKRSECKTKANKAEQRRVRETREVCAGCGAQVATLVYRDERGWVCERCAPVRRACKHQAQGCSHEDVDSKCRKHENRFCKQLTQCSVCWKVLHGRSSLSAHYSSACWPVCKDGATWRPVKTNMFEHKCLVSGAAGIAVCEYHLVDTEFNLWVYTPVTSERLREFGCVVRVTQPATGLEHTYTPELTYDKLCDWEIIVKKTEFPSWDCVFDVSVDIIKILN